MSLVLRPSLLPEQVPLITTAAATAIARAAETLTGEAIQIKWVNDLYLDGKKICGILTESVKSAEYNYIMIGIGINLTTADFPDDIQHKAGAVGIALNKDKTIAAICDNLSQIADAPFTTDYLKYYRENMIGVGEMITYIENGQEHKAEIEGINDLGELLVIVEHKRKRLCSGEITIISSETDSR